MLYISFIIVNTNLVVVKLKEVNVKNLDIRTEIKEAGLRLWQIADALGIDDSRLSKMLRYELNDQEKTKIRSIVKTLLHSQHRDK